MKRHEKESPTGNNRIGRVACSLYSCGTFGAVCAYGGLLDEFRFHADRIWCGSGVLYIAFARKTDAKSRFYGFPIAKIGAIYGIAQLVVGLVFMALSAWIPTWMAVLVSAILLGAAVIGLVSADAVTDEIDVQDEKLKKNVTFMRDLRSEVNQMEN